MKRCHYCGPTALELRPYGPGGASICFPCMKAAPEREDEAKRNYGTLLGAAEVMGDGVAVIGDESGPAPFSRHRAVSPAAQPTPPNPPSGESSGREAR